MKRAKWIPWLFLLSCVLPLDGPAQPWLVEAPLSVNQPGLVEVPLPAELHCYRQDALDLKVFGPDGKARSFELYWHEDQSDQILDLKEKSARLDNHLFIWETVISTKDRLRFQAIRINVLSRHYIGKVDIFGRKEGVWRLLADNAALYASDGETRQDIKIPDDWYEAFRLEFAAYAKKPVPISQVQALGRKTGQDYTEAFIPLNYRRTDRKDTAGQAVTDLTATLPGSGLNLQRLELLTQAQFTGRWRLEKQDMAGGRKIFIPEATGTVSGVTQGSAAFILNVDRIWPDNILNLQLTGEEDTLSEIRHFVAKIRVPRLVFLADTPGTYLLRTGLGHKAGILEYPSAQRLTAPTPARLGEARSNPSLQKENLIGQFPSGGAPFKADGYQWRSAVKLSGPGYHRFILHREASLEDNIQSLRIVRNGLQYPYFMEKGETRACPLTLRESHDPATNTTTWYLELPQASSRWTSLVLEARGIFSRTVAIERDQPRPVQGALWRTLSWRNASAAPSELTISLKGFPRKENKIRLVMSHGDNQPLKIEKAKACYEAPAIHFLADAPDGYELYGGNENAHAPSYDMQLIQGQLLRREPLAAQLSEPQRLQGTPLKNAVVTFFAKNNWGLYAVLGLLAVVLMMIIVRIFPKHSPPT